MQESFAQTLIDSIKEGMAVFDADMKEASTRLQALQTQGQLAIQLLKITNSHAGSILVAHVNNVLSCVRH